MEMKGPQSETESRLMQVIGHQRYSSDEGVSIMDNSD